MEKPAYKSKINQLNALLLAVATVVYTWFPEYKERVLETAVALGTIGNIVLRTWFTSVNVRRPNVSKTAIVLLAVLLTGCGWRVAERSKTAYATANTTYRIAQQVVIQLKRQDVISDAEWAAIRPINSKIATLDRAIFRLFVALEATEDVSSEVAELLTAYPELSEAFARAETPVEKITVLLAAYVDLIESIQKTIAEFKSRP